MDKHAKVLFSLAAAFNWLAGTPLIVAPQQFARLIGMQPVPTNLAFPHLVGALVHAFGWGYWRVARDPVANRSIIHVGILGRSLVVLAVCFDWLAGNTNWPLARVVSGDAVFAALFLDYLRQRPTRAS
jgi:hypothetical protein